MYSLSNGVESPLLAAREGDCSVNLSRAGLPGTISAGPGTITRLALSARRTLEKAGSMASLNSSLISGDDGSTATPESWVELTSTASADTAPAGQTSSHNRIRRQARHRFFSAVGRPNHTQNQKGSSHRFCLWLEPCLSFPRPGAGVRRWGLPSQAEADIVEVVVVLAGDAVEDRAVPDLQKHHVAAGLHL